VCQQPCRNESVRPCGTASQTGQPSNRKSEENIEQHQGCTERTNAGFQRHFSHFVQPSAVFSPFLFCTHCTKIETIHQSAKQADFCSCSYSRNSLQTRLRSSRLALRYQVLPCAVSSLGFLTTTYPQQRLGSQSLAFCEACS